MVEIFIMLRRSLTILSKMNLIVAYLKSNLQRESGKVNQASDQVLLYTTTFDLAVQLRYP